MTLLRRRARSRSCLIHGDNGCEIQGEAGPRERPQDTRTWRADVDDEFDAHDPYRWRARQMNEIWDYIEDCARDH